MNPLALPAAAKWIAVGLIVLAVLAFLAWGATKADQAGRDHVNAAVAEKHAEDVTHARALDQAIAFNQQEADRAPNLYHDAAIAGDVHAGAAGERLQQRFATINAGCLPDGAAASAGSPAASSAADLRADVLGGVVEAARQAASAADSFRVPGLKTEGSYDALRPSGK